MRELLDDGLDELAVSAHAGFFPRLAITLACQAVFAFILPLNICLIAAGVGATLEIIAWFATRKQFLRQSVGWRTRLWQIGGLAVSTVFWVTMGALLWQSGSLEGALCGVLVWLSVIFFAQANAYQSNAGFVVGGVLPALAVTAIVLMGPNPLHVRLIPFGLVLLIAFTFAADGVMRMLAARRELDESQSQVRQSADLSKMLFDQSPLPQIHFDASAVYELLRPHIAAGETSLGDILASKIRDISRAFQFVAYLGANQAAGELYGLTQFGGAVQARHFDPNFVTGFCASLNGLGPDGRWPPFETSVVRSDGSVVEVCLHIRTVPDSERPWSNCIGTFVDLTETRQAAAAMQAALVGAESANRAKSDFLATMSHEIRTPLNGVLGMVQAMERDPLPEGQRERLAVIGQSGETLLAILNDILDLSKIEAGKLDLEDAEFDLRALALEAQDTFRLMAESKGLEFTLRMDAAALGTYRGDAVRVRQILYNLISNAVKFTGEGAVLARIDRVEGGVRFQVSDTGIGVSPDQIERLFDKFVQGDASTTRRFGGTGLGLAICRELCMAMGGEITARSEVGRGSCFVVELPLVRLAATAPLARPGDRPLAAIEQRALRILAAEDNAVNQLVLKTLLGQAGFEPVVVADGEAAVAAWEESAWDVILMDVQMPVMDGPAATRLIRRRESETGRAPTPIIALTANAMTHQIDLYLAAGMNAFVAKPIEVRQLFEAITTAIRNDPEPEAAVA